MNIISELTSKKLNPDTDKRHQALAVSWLFEDLELYFMCYTHHFPTWGKKRTKMNIFYLHFYLFLPSRTKMMSKIFMKIMNYYLRLVKLTPISKGLSYTKE